MFDGDLHQDDAATLTRLHAVLDELTSLEVTGRSDAQLVALWREAEACRRRFAPLDHALIGEVRTRNLAHAFGARSITVLARDLLRISVGEASARVTAADALGGRRSFTGQVLDPIYGQVAAAQACGAIGESAAKAIVQMIDKLPDQVRCEQDVQVQEFLVAQAQILDVDGLRLIARRLAAVLDPDGLLKGENYRDRQRDVSFTVRPSGGPPANEGVAGGGGSSHGEFEGTAQFTEWLRTVLDTLARPKPETDGVKDPRSAGQRRHDGLLDAFQLLARANQLPDAAGISTTVLVTISDEALATGEHRHHRVRRRAPGPAGAQVDRRRHPTHPHPVHQHRPRDRGRYRTAAVQPATTPGDDRPGQRMCVPRL